MTAGHPEGRTEVDADTTAPAAQKRAQSKCICVARLSTTPKDALANKDSIDAIDSQNWWLNCCSKLVAELIAWSTAEFLVVGCILVLPKAYLLRIKSGRASITLTVPVYLIMTNVLPITHPPTPGAPLGVECALFWSVSLFYRTDSEPDFD